MASDKLARLIALHKLLNEPRFGVGGVSESSIEAYRALYPGRSGLATHDPAGPPLVLSDPVLPNPNAQQQPEELELRQAWGALRMWIVRNMPPAQIRHWLPTIERALNPLPDTMAYDAVIGQPFGVVLVQLLDALVKNRDFDDSKNANELILEAFEACQNLLETLITPRGRPPKTTKEIEDIFRDSLGKEINTNQSLNEASREVGFIITNRGNTYTRNGKAYSRTSVSYAWDTVLKEHGIVRKKTSKNKKKLDDLLKESLRHPSAWPMGLDTFRLPNSRAIHLG